MSDTMKRYSTQYINTMHDVCDWTPADDAAREIERQRQLVTDSFHNVLKARQTEIERLEARVTRYKMALKEISEGRGAYDRNPFKHAVNCLEESKHIATLALEKERDELARRTPNEV